MLVANMFSAMPRNKLHGKDQLSITETGFKATVFISDSIIDSIEFIDIRIDKPICTLRAVCLDSRGDIVIT